MGIRKLFKWNKGNKSQEMGDTTIDELEAFSKLREKAYHKLFGSDYQVSHELEIKMPHIDVYICPPRKEGRPFYTLVSGGMSDFPMQLEEGVDHSYARREIILYCDKPDDELIGFVRFFAHFPFEFSTWLGSGHTVPNGAPPKPLFENSILTGTYFMNTLLVSDRQLGKKLAFRGDPVEFLWAIPITQAEMDLKLEKGADALLDLFEEHKHPLVLDRYRASYV